jgi:hypothetical protein
MENKPLLRRLGRRGEALMRRRYGWLLDMLKKRGCDTVYFIKENKLSDKLQAHA